MHASHNERERTPSLWLAWWRTGVTRLLLLWEHPAWAALLAMLVYTAFALHRDPLLRSTPYPYFNYLADALLHGQLHLRLLPTVKLDLSLFEGRYYLYWPPLPAILLMPFVALFGVGFSDVRATIALGGLNVAIIALLLRHADRRAVAPVEPVQRAMLVLFFALGTVHTTLAPYGKLWYLGQLVGFACVALTYLAALSLRELPAFVLAGTGIAAALLTRNHLALAGLWPTWYLLREHRALHWKRLVGYGAAGLLPVVAAIGLLAVYNALRFGDVFDNGLAYHQMAPRFAQDYQRYGAFHLHYLPTNLFYQWIAYPFPLRRTSLLGGSLLLLSPVFFGAIGSLIGKRTGVSNWLLAGTVLLVNIPILLLMGTGWVQWGPRYTLDYTVPLLLLTAVGVRHWPSWVLGLLTVLSIVHYIVGTIYLAQFV